MFRVINQMQVFTNRVLVVCKVHIIIGHIITHHHHTGIHRVVQMEHNHLKQQTVQTLLKMVQDGQMDRMK